jgi:hypothetical protein
MDHVQLYFTCGHHCMHLFSSPLPLCHLKPNNTDPPSTSCFCRRAAIFSFQKIEVCPREKEYAFRFVISSLYLVSSLHQFLTVTCPVSLFCASILKLSLKACLRIRYKLRAQYCNGTQIDKRSLSCLFSYAVCRKVCNSSFFFDALSCHARAIYYMGIPSFDLSTYILCRLCINSLFFLSCLVLFN